MVTFITMSARVVAWEVAADPERVSDKRVERSPDWTAEVMRIAADLFLEHGYAGVSVASIVEVTGGSFREVYREFGSKEGLFLRAMHFFCEQVVEPWRLFEPSQLPVHEALFAFGKAVVNTLLSPRLLALHRLVLSEATRFQALADTWFQAGPKATSIALERLLGVYIASNELQLEDPATEAVLLLDSMLGDLQLRRLIGQAVPEEEVDNRIRASVRMFLRGVERTSGIHKTGAKIK